MNILTYDLVASYGVTRREYTDEGFLKVPGRVARAGTQQYLASEEPFKTLLPELGITDKGPFDIITVYRPPEEVFNVDSLASYDSKDVTDDHPDEMVSAETYKTLTVGHVRGIGSQDGDFVSADLIVKDANAIKKIESGKVQLSAGYTADYDYSPGATEDGTQYEFIQRNIRINHVALVDKARAGAMARVFDKSPIGDKPMPQVTLDNGRAIDLQSQETAALVQDSLDRLKSKADDAAAAEAKAKDSVSSMQAKLEAKDEELAKAKALTSDEAIRERLSGIQSTLDRARKIAGKDFTSDSLDPVQIKREALAKVRDSIDWASKDNAYVDGAFEAAEEKESEDNEEEEKEKKSASDSMSRLAASLSKGTKDKDKPSAKDAFVSGIENAWKSNSKGA